MSINVETIGNALIIQHLWLLSTGQIIAVCYRFLMRSLPTGAAKFRYYGNLEPQNWTIKRVNIPTKFMQQQRLSFEFMKVHNISLTQAAHDRQVASDAHNHEETPLFAKSIEKKAAYRQLWYLIEWLEK